MTTYYLSKLKLLSLYGIILLTISACVSKGGNEKLQRDYDDLLSDYNDFLKNKNDGNESIWIVARERNNYRKLLNEAKLLPKIVNSSVFRYLGVKNTDKIKIRSIQVERIFDNEFKVAYEKCEQPMVCNEYDWSEVAMKLTFFYNEQGEISYISRDLKSFNSQIYK